jgi:excinuclease ABC subunit A
MRDRAMRFVETVVCPTCHGDRLRPEALAVTFAGRNIAQLAALPLAELADVLRPTAQLDHPETAVLSARSGEGTEVAVQIAADLCQRISVLIGLGLGYLSIGRATTTLSAGELQRLRIATQLRSGLFGVVYVLDEPSAGLHPADAEPLMAVLDQLREGGNSVFVVEHDMDIVGRADWMVDVGPCAGVNGGRVLYSGPVKGLADIEESITRRHLFPDRSDTATHDVRAPTEWLELAHLVRHNLRDVSVSFPLGVLTAVTGVSGSGKSSLVIGELADTDRFDRVVVVDQQPIGRTPRSNLATYTGMFDAVRKVFAATPTAKKRGWGPGRFSFNVADGRCETCQGDGFVEVELLFLPGTHGPCPVCHGRRFEPATLEVRYQGRSVADVLELTVDQALDALADVPAAVRSLGTLAEVGLGYLRLGQPATEFSGGEAQRIKLATELQRVRRGEALYLLDEPTSGLHPADIELLSMQLHRLVDRGDTVVVVEHDMGMVAGADWVIDLGPGAGDDGGSVVAAGTPLEVAASPDSRTAPYLAAYLHRR